MTFLDFIYFSALNVQFSVKLFFVARLLHSHFIALRVWGENTAA